MKVARYEVPGTDAKRDVRPDRDDRNVWLLVSRIRLHEPNQPSIVPAGTGRVSFSIPGTFVPGYIHWVPAGRLGTRRSPSKNLTDMLTHMVSR